MSQALAERHAALFYRYGFVPKGSSRLERFCGTSEQKAQEINK